MKYFNHPLFCLAVLVAIVCVPAVVIHSFVDKSVDNTAKNEQPAPISTPTPQASKVPTGDDGLGNVRGVRTSQPTASPVPDDSGMDSCSSTTKEAEAAGWHILSCDPLRVMPLEEWNQKSASPNFRYRPELYCFDESNFAGIFQEQLGEDDGTGYYPDWLSEMKLDNGCSFFFHPNQGHGNGAPDERG